MASSWTSSSASWTTAARAAWIAGCGQTASSCSSRTGPSRSPVSQWACSSADSTSRGSTESETTRCSESTSGRVRASRANSPASRTRAVSGCTRSERAFPRTTCRSGQDTRPWSERCPSDSPAAIARRAPASSPARPPLPFSCPFPSSAAAASSPRAAGTACSSVWKRSAIQRWTSQRTVASDSGSTPSQRWYRRILSATWGYCSRTSS